MPNLIPKGLTGAKWYYFHANMRDDFRVEMVKMVLLITSMPAMLDQSNAELDSFRAGLTGSKWYYYFHAMLDQNNADFDIFGADWFKKLLLPCLPCLIKVMPNLILLGLTGSKWHPCYDMLYQSNAEFDSC